MDRTVRCRPPSPLEPLMDTRLDPRISVSHPRSGEAFVRSDTLPDELIGNDPRANAGPAPPLWNPGAAAAWSFLFSPMFGSWLAARNWQALGERAHAKRQRWWIAATLVLAVANIWVPMI